MLLRQYEMPWRSPVEGAAALAWILAAAILYFLIPEHLPPRAGVLLIVVSILIALIRCQQALRVVRIRAALSGRAMEMVPISRLAKWTGDPEQVVFGLGFIWLPLHSQRLYELIKIDYRAMTISPWLIRALGYQPNPQSDAEIGLPWIHGVESEERLLIRPLQNFEGGTLVVGTTQSGKGVCLGWLIFQAIRRGDVVIIIDPKNSRRLKRLVMKACQLYREPILEQALERFYEQLLGMQWRSTPEMVRLLDKARRGQIKSPTPAASQELLAYVTYYDHHVHEARRDPVVSSQVRVFQHNREHYQKITANLLPILSMLTSGDLGKSLSPDPFDADDQRPIMNLEKIERAGHVLLLCLDSLPDPSVATAIGAMALADLAARSGIRYNLGGERRIALFVDELSNVINQPLIEILNKGAEGGLYTTAAMQTIADLAKRLGSQEAARMALGNLNNLIAFRTKDQPTQEFINETLGQTTIHNMKVGHNTARDGHFTDFTAVDSTQLSEEVNELVPPSLLGTSGPA